MIRFLGNKYLQKRLRTTVMAAEHYVEIEKKGNRVRGVYNDPDIWGRARDDFPKIQTIEKVWIFTCHKEAMRFFNKIVSVNI